MASLVVYFVLLNAAILTAWLLSQRKEKLPPGTKLLPGPPGKPLVGNLLEIPPQHSWLKFREYINQYGPMVRLSIAGQNHVIIGKEGIMNDLLRERGTIYSDRYDAIAAVRLLCDDQFMLFLPYNEQWRKSRRFMHHVCTSSVAPTYRPEQALEAIRELRDIIRAPEDYQIIFECASVGIGMRLIYGQRLESGRAHECRKILKIVHELERVGSPGAYLVDIFPWMLHIPDFLAPWKRYLKAQQKVDEAFFTEMVDRTKRDLEKGKTARSFTKTWLESKEKWGLSNREAIWMFGSVFDAAATSTSSAMMSFVLAMVRNPEWFSKLQAEIDRVVGPGRLPTYEDMPNLPLVRACVKETLRYYPVTAGGFPHKLTQDDVYNGYFLKAGTIVHPVQWAIHRDPELYPDPDTFNPGRWLDPAFPTYKEPLTVYPNLQNYTAFGGGRRICQGISIAENSTILQVAYLAWGTDIRRAKDANGVEIIPPYYDYEIGFNVAPKRFQFDLAARSERKAELIEWAYQQSLEDDPLYEKT
ncbi:cytochrome P450 [Coniochaeta sp. 2T2.1]|nr:cytochrome P450 [Coniochaeta sp. 2T2.1]